MANVTELGYLGISVSDAAAWKNYATEVMGMQLVDEGEADRFYLRMDLWHHRIVVHTGGDDDLAYVGWRVAGAQELEQMAAKLTAAGIEVRRGTEAEAAERRVLGLLKLQDPAGNAHEIFYSPLVDGHKPFHPGRPMFGGFKTGDQGVGHIILRSVDPEATMRFFAVLGVTGSSDYLLKLTDGTPVRIPFLKCNNREHSVALMFGPMPKRANHLMVEYQDMRDLGQTLDKVHKHGIDIAVQLGVHSNDGALSFYAANPSGWLWEPGWSGVCAPAQQEHFRCDVFGHDLDKAQYVGGVNFRSED
ncbi:VOC family protein [Acidovorax sp. JG5]|uniref:VOC family protein n=1 Tax=Acidovorax sp. JG5 TaxID=2822718 RepID=UPI001B333191|nr:VOC family protein [Acidovorax sp. JG5]MBP3982468.1 VOC family protein [Acidovorax sp. JG5]